MYSIWRFEGFQEAVEVANGTEDVVLVSRETLALVTSTVEGVVLLPEISIPNQSVLARSSLEFDSTQKGRSLRVKRNYTYVVSRATWTTSIAKLLALV
jgi:hypothetical protein